MKFVIFLVTCLVTADAGCECPEGDLLEEAAKNAWCNDSVNFVGLVTVKNSGKPTVAGKYFEYHGYIEVDPASVLKSTTLQVNKDKARHRQIQGITIQMLDDGCSMLPVHSSGSLRLGGLLNPGNTLLTMTGCDYETWKSQPLKKLHQWKENPTFCEDHKAAKQSAKQYNEKCIDPPPSLDSKLEDDWKSQRDSIYDVCFDGWSSIGSESRRLWCSADFVGTIILVKGTELETDFLVKVDSKIKRNPYKNTTKFIRFKEESAQTQNPENFLVRLPTEKCITKISSEKQLHVRGVVSEENSTILNVTSCDYLWRVVEGKDDDLEGDPVCEEGNKGSYTNQWCSADFVGRIVVVPGSLEDGQGRNVGVNGLKEFQVKVDAAYKESANFTQHVKWRNGEIVNVRTKNHDCINAMENRTGEVEIPVRGKVRVTSAMKPYIRVNDCTKTWWDISVEYAAELNKTCGTGRTV